MAHVKLLQEWTAIRHPRIMRRFVFLVPFMAAGIWGAVGCARGPDCNTLAHREAEILNACGIDADVSPPDECLEQAREFLECWVSCMEAASCDALDDIDKEANGKFIACLDFCTTFVDLPDAESDG